MVFWTFVVVLRRHFELEVFWAFELAFVVLQLGFEPFFDLLDLFFDLLDFYGSGLLKASLRVFVALQLDY